MSILFNSDHLIHMMIHWWRRIYDQPLGLRCSYSIRLIMSWSQRFLKIARLRENILIFKIFIVISFQGVTTLFRRWNWIANNLEILKNWYWFIFRCLATLNFILRYCLNWISRFKKRYSILYFDWVIRLYTSSMLVFLLKGGSRTCKDRASWWNSTQV